MEAVSSPIDLARIPTSGCRSPCRQQRSAAETAHKSYGIDAVNEFDPLDQVNILE
jgi:hypothetical protein